MACWRAWQAEVPYAPESPGTPKWLPAERRLEGDTTLLNCGGATSRTLALGTTYYYSHNLEAARAELLKVSAKPATAAGGNYFLGRIADDLGQWPLAVKLLERAIQWQPRDADAYAALGGVYLNQKDFSQSGQALEHAVKLDPDNYLANLNLMKPYGRTRDSRAEAQSQRFAELKQERDERAKLFLRTIRVVP